MNHTTLQPPGSYLRLIAAGSHGIGGRRIPLGEIALNADEHQGLLNVVSHHWITNSTHLSVEQHVQWGALVLFLVASSKAPGPLKSPLNESVTVDQLDAIRAGIGVLERLHIPGAPEAFQVFHAAVMATGGARPSPVDMEESDRNDDSLYVLEAEPMRPVLNHHRIRVRVVPNPEGMPDAGTMTVNIIVPLRADVVARMGDAPGAAAISDAGVELSVGEDWTEILFRLMGPAEEDVIVEVVRREGHRNLQGFRLEVPFRVSVLPSTVPSGGATPPYEEAVLRVREYLWVHGAITEGQIRRIFASVLAFRRFLSEAKQHFGKLPFAVSLETTRAGRRWVKGGGAR